MPRTVGRSTDLETPVQAAVGVPIAPLTVVHVAAEYWPVAQTDVLVPTVPHCRLTLGCSAGALAGVAPSAVETR